MSHFPLQIMVGRWDELEERAKCIRHDVFVLEQHVPLALEWDGIDDQCWHGLALLTDETGVQTAVGTGRLVLEGEELKPGMGKIGRMAILWRYRGHGVGSVLLKALIEKARELGMVELLLHAQLYAREFYLIHGFEESGEFFDEAGIEHIAMRLQL
ncbi:MAG: GNAT family N-acetyltransferase [Candidatus Protistobacter heckmanni]|nr:GNAT family N-acetyltransferase [Candidatus Protistobacter heckmanni]